MNKKLTITYQQGTTLLDHTGNNYPEKFNEDMKFAPSVRASFARNARRLYKAIKKISPGFQQRPKMLPVFGDPTNWKAIPWPTDKEGKVPAHLQEREPEYRVIDLLKVETVELDSQASDAVAAILLRLSHPDSRECLSPMSQEEIVWPIADQLGLVPWLEKKIGITAGQVIEVEYALNKEDGKPAEARSVSVEKGYDPVPVQPAT
jgi:hypothetical protein